MIRLTGWLCSLILHLALMEMVILWPAFSGGEHVFKGRVYEVDIIQLKEIHQPVQEQKIEISTPEPERQQEPTPDPPKVQPASQPEPPVEPSAESTAEPTSTPTAPQIAPGEIAISPVKRKGALSPEVVENPMPAEIHLGKGEVKEGAESRFMFGIPGTGRDTYERADALGYFGQEDRELAVLQREDGGLALYEFGKNFLRKLEPLNKYIYTYTDSAGKVAGSVTFLGDGEDLYRFMWLDENNRALFPTRLKAVEEPLTIKVRDGRLQGTLVLPYGQAAAPVVVLLPLAQCNSSRAGADFARLLAANGLGALALNGRGCQSGGAEAGNDPLELWVGDVQRAIAEIKSREGTSSVGVWASGEAVEALSRFGQGDADFIIAEPETGEAILPDINALPRNGVSVLWLTGQSKDSAWPQRVETLEATASLLGGSLAVRERLSEDGLLAVERRNMAAAEIAAAFVSGSR